MKKTLDPRLAWLDPCFKFILLYGYVELEIINGLPSSTYEKVNDQHCLDVPVASKTMILAVPLAMVRKKS